MQAQAFKWRQTASRVLGIANPLSPEIGKLTQPQVRAIYELSLTKEDREEILAQEAEAAMTKDIDRIALLDDDDRKKSLTIKVPKKKKPAEDEEEVWVQ